MTTKATQCADAMQKVRWQEILPSPGLSSLPSSLFWSYLTDDLRKKKNQQGDTFMSECAQAVRDWAHFPRLTAARVRTWATLSTANCASVVLPEMIASRIEGKKASGSRDQACGPNTTCLNCVRPGICLPVC